MAASVTYATFNGVLVYEIRGGVETEYTPDTLGNLIECHGPDGVSTYTADYWPYGEVRTSTGTNPSPWGFVGLLGYYTDALNFLYVRARYYRPQLTRWQTVDPLWPRQPKYGYCGGKPTYETDASGLYPWDSESCKLAYQSALDSLRQCFDESAADLLATVMQCIASGESDCNKQEGGGGLYQIDNSHYQACCTGVCCHCRGQRGCNTMTAVAMFTYYFSHSGGWSNIEDALCSFWGVLACSPGHNRPGSPTGSGAQGTRTMDCLHHKLPKGKTLFDYPIPNPRPGAPKQCTCRNTP